MGEIIMSDPREVDQQMRMIAEIQRKISEGTISHSAINQDRRSPLGWNINGGHDFHPIEHLSIVEVGVFFKQQVCLRSAIK
jgi:hypothetical protein